MKKLILILSLLLCGCQRQPQYYLYVYYAKTCPVCRSFINVVIPELEEKYGTHMTITKLNIDQEESIEAYAKTCSLLEEYEVNDDSGSVPFIVLDGYFAKVGYDIGEDEEMLQAIDDAIEGRELSSDLENIYYFMEGKTYR